jgi:hypothetical protein
MDTICLCSDSHKLYYNFPVVNWYRELHPTKEGKRKLRFLTLTFDGLPLYGRAKKHRNCRLKDSKGIVRAGITEGRLWWTPDYAWNGCSPKFYLGFPPVGKWVGTPDFEETLKPSLGHDILFQFGKLLDISFEDANMQFYYWMQDEHFWFAEQYYDAVEMFGEKFWGKDPDTLTIEYV